MHKKDVIVVGGGLFGATIAKALRAQGRDVLVFDSAKPQSGSAPSGCLMKPSWLTRLGKEVTENGFRTLDELYGLQTVEFQVGKIPKKAKVYRVDTNQVLDLGDMRRQQEVIRVGSGFVEDSSGVRYEAPLVVVAAGVWTKQLLHVEGLQAKMGVAFRYHGKTEPRIRPWAPYKQLVKFQEASESVWCGDGTSLKPESFTDERLRVCEERARGFANHSGPMRPYVGQRPYVRGAKPCVLEERAPGLWVATGGAKSGTIAAGWAAHHIREVTS